MIWLVMECSVSHRVGVIDKFHFCLSFNNFFSYILIDLILDLIFKLLCNQIKLFFHFVWLTCNMLLQSYCTSNTCYRSFKHFLGVWCFLIIIYFLNKQFSLFSSLPLFVNLVFFCVSVSKQDKFKKNVERDINCICKLWAFENKITDCNCKVDN